MLLARFINWLYTQSSLQRIFKVTVLLGIFGFIPGAWLVGIPALSIYGFYKRRVLKTGIINAIRTANNIWHDFSAHLGEFISHQITNHPIKLLKLFVSMFLFATMSMPFCFLGIYGLYRFTNEEWQQSFTRCADGVLRFFSVGVANTLQGASFNKKIALGAIVSVTVAMMARSSGMMFFVELGLMAAQYALVYTGVSAFFRDARVWLRKPISNTSQNSGKILGTLWGRWLSYEIFTGTLVGTMGPAIGQVKTQGVISGLIPAFLSPQKGWFAFNSGYFSILFSKISTLFNSVISTFFFSHNMKLWGDFQGYIGPNSFQVFSLMIIGLMVGYATEKFVDLLYQSMKNDVSEIADAASPSVRRARGAVYDARWHLAYTAIVTPIILSSPGAGQLFALGGGSLLGATGLTAGLIGLSMAGIYGVAHTLSRIAQRIMRRAEVAPERAHALPTAAVVPAPELVLLPAAAPGFMPGFSGSRVDPVEADPHPNPLPQAVEGTGKGSSLKY
jgi:hypothetical protein